MREPLRTGRQVVRVAALRRERRVVVAVVWRERHQIARIIAPAVDAAVAALESRLRAEQIDRLLARLAPKQESPRGAVCRSQLPKRPRRRVLLDQPHGNPSTSAMSSNGYESAVRTSTMSTAR